MIQSVLLTAFVGCLFVMALRKQHVTSIAFGFAFVLLAFMAMEYPR
jgi:hypothetical protein